jgi:hypothetical protein
MSDEQIPPQQKPLKPGKGYGITALLCSMAPIFSFGYYGLLMLLMEFGPRLSFDWQLILIIPFFILVLASLPHAIAGIVFGILGRKTEGWLFASIGRTLCLLFVLLTLAAIIDFVVFPPPDLCK